MYPKYFFEFFREFERTEEVFVAMPFTEAFRPRWDYIFVPAIESVKLIPYRVDARLISDSILTDILRGIGRAKLILGDISIDENGYRNGNVMYELGIAHAIRLAEEVIILRSDNDKLLFDINQVRIINININDIDTSIRQLTDIFINSIKEINTSKDLIVNKTVTSFDSACFYIMHVIKESYSLFMQPPPDSAGNYGPLSNQEARRGFSKLQELCIIEPISALDEKTGIVKYRLTALGEAIIKRFPYLLDLGKPRIKKG
jgi:hypothetical protein